MFYSFIVVIVFDFLLLLGVHYVANDAIPSRKLKEIRLEGIVLS